MKRLVLSGCLAWFLASAALAQEGKTLTLNLRSRVETSKESGRFHAVTKPTQWQAAETAIIVCDMWDDHYCVSAAKRVAEMAPRMNEVLKAARSQGVLIIHCPSGCMDKYADTPARKLAQQAPPVETKIPLKNWCHLEEAREGKLPIDDSEPNDDETPREKKRFYTRQIETLEIAPGDAVTDSAEAYYLMQQRGIKHAIVMGVHVNMCVLGRPFGIRQLTYQGMDVALMRDMTDAMYSPKQRPFVSHFTGNDLVIEHIEKNWCPSLTSSDFIGGQPFRFAADKRPHLVIVMAEDEYKTETTLPAFAASHLGRDFKVSLIYNTDGQRNQIPGLDVLREADIALFSLRRRTLAKADLDMFRQHVAAGKPVVGIRTASHGFSQRSGTPPEGSDEWPSFDHDVLGGNYQNHHANDIPTFVRTIEAQAKHPILTGVSGEEFRVQSSLYRNTPLAETATPLMMGRAADLKPHEPVAWTNQRPDSGRVFYTSLGHVEDFKIPAFQRLLLNGIYWAANLPVPAQLPAEQNSK